MRTSSNQQEVVLARDGKVRFVLHRLPWQSAEDLIGPADELVSYLERSLGQPVPTEDPRGEPSGRPVVLALHCDVRSDLDREEFELAATPERVARKGMRARSDISRHTGFDWLYPAAFLADRQAELTEAARLAAHDADLARRVQFIQAGLSYTRFYCDACRATVAACDAAGGGNLADLDVADLPADKRDEIIALAARAVGAWDSFWDFVREHMGRYVFAEFWVHYGHGAYGSRDLALRKLRELTALKDAEEIV